MIVEGGCHCGTVRFQVSIESPQVELLSCDCSICRMTGYLHLIIPETRFKLTEGKRDTTTYRFGTGKARHIFCTQCGIKSSARNAGSRAFTSRARIPTGSASTGIASTTIMA